MSDPTLSYTVLNGIGVLRFQRPAALNALSEQMFDELAATLNAVEADADLRALILIGEGKAFCVGLDLGLLEKAFDDIGYFERTVRRVAGTIERIEALSIPTVAAINGYARAGGFEMAMGCDFIVVADDAKIGDAHTDAGVMPACVSLRLKRRVGEQKAKELLWTARWLTGAEAVDYGLAIKVFPAASLLDDTIAFVRTMIDKPAPVLAALKRVFIDGGDLSPVEGTEFELRAFVDYMGSQPYGREGYYAYREKRTPTWRT